MSDQLAWSRVRDLFDRAVALEPGERAAFLDSSCPDDPEARREAEGLLEDHDRSKADRFLTTPEELREFPAAGGPDPDAMVGRSLGAYRVEGVIPGGGMADVYLARRVDDFERRVALKVFRGGDAARFAFERQVLADLEHPGIARLLDGGAVDGRPYLVMEFVDGARLDRHCEAAGLDLRARLALFARACEAVEFAHNSGVLHRDLKPGNILVAADGTPRLLDFGVARLLTPERDRSGGEPTRDPNARYFTPEYASPEQVAGGRLMASSDVYSLGVILHELMTGRRPTISAEDGEAWPPSRSAGRDSRRALLGDLDTIALAALRKEPSRRYASVAALHADVVAYLEGRPVAARGDSWAYRSAKFARRRPDLVALAASLVALIGLAAAGAVRYERRLRGERDESRKNFEVALEANVAVKDLADRLRPLAGTRAETIGGVLDLASKNYERLEERAGRLPEVLTGKAAMLNTFSEIYVEMGDTAGALRASGDSVAILEPMAGPEDEPVRVLLASALDRLGIALAHRGRQVEGLAAFRRALSIREARTARSPLDPARRADLAQSRQWIGAALASIGDLRASEASARQALDLRALVAREAGSSGLPESSKWLGQYASSLEWLGKSLYNAEDYPGAERALGEAGEIYARLREGDGASIDWIRGRVRVLIALADVAKWNDQGALAAERYRSALDAVAPFVAVDPKSAEWLRYSLQVRFKQADLLGPGRQAEARSERLASMEQTLVVSEARAKRDPSNVEWRRDVARVLMVIGRIRSSEPGQAEDARACLDRAASLLGAGAGRDDFDDLTLLQSVLSAQADLNRPGDPARAARIDLDRSKLLDDFYRRRAEAEPDNVSWPEQRAANQKLAANRLVLAGDYEGAVRAYEECLATHRRIAALQPGRPEHERAHAAAIEGLSDAFAALGKSGEALEATRRFVAIRRDLTRAVPADPKDRRPLADSLKALRARIGAVGDREGERAAWLEWLDALAALQKLDPAESGGDPFAPPPAPASQSVELATRALRARELGLCRQAVGVNAGLSRLEPDEPMKTDDLATSIPEVVRRLDLSRAADRREARELVAKGLAGLLGLAGKGTLHDARRPLLEAYRGMAARLEAP